MYTMDSRYCFKVAPCFSVGLLAASCDTWHYCSTLKQNWYELPAFRSAPMVTLKLAISFIVSRHSECHYHYHIYNKLGYCNLNRVTQCPSSIYLLLYGPDNGWGVMLRAGRSQVRYPMKDSESCPGISYSYRM
jgi:hypothetical protein